MSDRNAESGIHKASYYGNIETVRELIRNGEDINCQNKDGKTPLMLALIGNAKKKKKGHMIDFLLRNGADVNFVSKDGDPILHFTVRASAYRHISKRFVRSLLSYGADNKKLCKSGETAYQLAYQIGNANLGDLLMFYDPDRIRIKKKPGTMSDLLSLVFPTYAFHRQLREDLTETIEERKNNMLVHNKAPERYSEVSLPNMNNTVEKETVATLDHIDDSLEKISSNDAINNDSEEYVELENNETEKIQYEDIENELSLIDLIREEKTTVAQLPNKQEFTSQTKQLHCVGSPNILPIREVKRSNIHQLCHIGNECNTIRRNDGKIHQLSHIGNECNIRHSIDENINYLYA